MAQGVHGRRRVGQGETFWQFRQYQPGDAASRIDWRESAKSQRLYVRETEWEAAQSVWLWRDASAVDGLHLGRIFAGADWPTKRERAELLLVALASLLVRGGERLTLLGSGIAPMSGRMALTRVVDLSRSRAARRATRSACCRFRAAAARRPARADRRFSGAARGDQRAWSPASPRAGLRGHLLQVVDPAEEDLPFDGRVRFAGVEERDEIVDQPRRNSPRRIMRRASGDHRDGLAGDRRAVGWTLWHAPHRPPAGPGAARALCRAGGGPPAVKLPRAGGCGGVSLSTA